MRLLDVTENVWLDVPPTLPWGPSVCSGRELWATARFIFQYQLITKQPTVLGKGSESQCARSLLPRIAIKCHALAHWQKHRWGSRISHDLYLVQSPSNAKQSFDILSTSMFECLCICAIRLVIFQRRTVGSPRWPSGRTLSFDQL